MKKKKFPTYKELVAKKIANKRMLEEYKRKQDIENIANIAVDAAKYLDVTPTEILNAMGMYRFGIKYDGAYKLE